MKTYIPILKWKKGEKIALSKLYDEVKKSITPLIEITTDEEDAKDFLEDLSKYYKDPIYLDTEIVAVDDFDFLLSILQKAKEENIKIYPVINYVNISDIRQLFPYTQKIAIKINLDEDFEDDDDIYKNVFEKIKQISLSNDKIKFDLLLNLGFLNNQKEATIQFKDVKNIINDYLKDENFYNKIIICSTSFPEDLSKLQAGQKVIKKRFDFHIYKKLISYFKNISANFIYSDYGVTKFTDTDIDFSKMKYGILPKLKYTCEDSYLICKGERNKNGTGLKTSYFELAEQLLNSNTYFGQNFCFGDKDIYERYQKAIKNGNKKCGNSQNWVSISANHHISVVVQQLSKLF